MHPIATAQLLDGSPGEATNLREPGRYGRRGEDRGGAESLRGMDLCNGVDVYVRQWINIALDSLGPKWFNSSF